MPGSDPHARGTGPIGGRRPGVPATSRPGRRGRTPRDTPRPHRHRTARVLRASANGVGRGARGAALGSSVAARAGVRRVRRLTHAQGMGESGLAKLLELHVFNTAGDAAVTVGLAGTLFFAVPSHEARGRIGLYLVLTMAPFVVVAPLIGPVLDRLRRGRRWAIGTTMASRAFLCWILAGAVSNEHAPIWMYPLALGCLVASKAYGITRSAAVPRLLPPKVALVTVNSRMSLAGLAGTTVSGGIAGGLSVIGPSWALRWGFLVFIGATVLSILLPARVDSTVGEQEQPLIPTRAGRLRMPRTVVDALRPNAGLRALSGFLIMFLAFLLRESPISTAHNALVLSAVAAAAAIGSASGAALGSLTRAHRPESMIRLVIALAAAATIVAAALYGPVTVIVVALFAGFCQQFGKLALDAVIQRDVAEAVRTSIFARSETLLQLSWVAGAGLGVVIPLIAPLGFGLASAWLVGSFVVLLHALHAGRSRAVAPAEPAEPAAGAHPGGAPRPAAPGGGAAVAWAGPARDDAGRWDPSDDLPDPTPAAGQTAGGSPADLPAGHTAGGESPPAPLPGSDAPERAGRSGGDADRRTVSWTHLRIDGPDPTIPRPLPSVEPGGDTGPGQPGRYG